jgi:hypothetical protein
VLTLATTDAPDIATFSGANWTGYDWTPNGDAYARRADARPVWSARPSAGTSRFQTRGSLRVVRIGSVCPDCCQTYRPNGDCYGCD